MTTPPPIPAELYQLIKRFDDNRDAYRAGTYNETMVRREFIDPFLTLLGWDVNNTKGFAEAYKEVVHEDAVLVGGTTKAPDYSLRIGGQRKLFVEAKKPAVNIKADAAPAFQVRRYAWSAKLPLSILTDFEEFAVYDCTAKPNKEDNASHGRIKYLTYQQYPEHWAELVSLFSPQAIMRGSFDKFAQSSQRKRGTTEVDQAFLEEISQWRDELARNIALRNKNIKTRDLNHAVQATIDRLIFLRIAEDRGIEPYGRLRQAVEGKEAYAELGRLFQLADAKYNSGLFHFKAEKGQEAPPDTFTLSLAIDDKVLKGIIKRLYYPDSPYQFDVIPADILGQVYEQFLGKVIRLTAGGQAKVEEKPEVKKAGGVFYTPTYIVDYIVAQTVGKLLEGRTAGPKGTASPLRVLDPACGSGSFLLGAYQFLLDWHLAQYTADPAIWTRGKNPTLYQNDRGEYKLTITERKRILLNNIYGVDIDPQAVEVTKLSLLLKVMEGETEATLGTQQRLLPERVLPDLSSNIKCGNSLIGPDFYDGGTQTGFGFYDEEEMYRINVFDWSAAFPTIVPHGGFDAVIGNPPYIRIQALKEFAPREVEFYKKGYQSASKGNYDIYVVFVEKGLQLLNSTGLLGYILPHKFFNAQYGEALRRIVADGGHLTHVVHFGAQQVFARATTYTCLLFLTAQATEAFEFVRVEDLHHWEEFQTATTGMIPTSQVQASEWNFVVGQSSELFHKLNNYPKKLGDVADVFVGLQTSADYVFILEFVSETESTITLKSHSLNTLWSFEKDLFYPIVSGTDVKGFTPLPSRQYILFPYEVTDENPKLIPLKKLANDYPLTMEYLLANKTVLEAREKGKFKDSEWYRFGRSQNLGIQARVKLCVPRLVEKLHAGFDSQGTHCLDNVDVCGVTLKVGENEYSLIFLLGLLNSRLIKWVFPYLSAPFRGGWFSANRQFLSQLPLCHLNLDVQIKLEDLVNALLDIHQRLAAAQTPHEKMVLQRQIALTDRQINQLVYQLYELTPEEIALVEASA